MIHNHHHHQMHQMQMNVSQPPPPQQSLSQQSNSQQRMNHHHYQQRLNHQQIQQQQQQLPPQIHGSRGNSGGSGGGGGAINSQHQIPPPIIQKQHLHQNIATLNQKPPPQHVNSQTSQNSQIQPSVTVAQRMSYEKTNNLKRESSSISVPHSATATLPANNNSSIVTGPTSSIAAVPTTLSQHHHHNHHHMNNSSSNLMPKYHQHHQVIDITKSNDIKSTPVVSANKENIPLNSSQQQTHNGNSGGIILSNNSHSEVISAESTEQGIESLANAKEKTPMCLVNELARFNKIQHQYRLVSEQGPAHKKRFTVILKLGEEEYAAEGLSIKKAQHAAAKDAIMKTSYKHPPLKVNRQLKGLQSVNAKGNTGNITPTVELNALAMKRGEPTVYTFVNTTTNPSIAPNMTFGQQQLPPPPSQYNSRGNSYQRRPYQRGGLSNSRYNYNGTEIFHVALQVGSRTFTGMGPTQQAARHDAAARALEVLKPLVIESDSQKMTTSEGEGDDADDSLINSDIKSPISIVHEMALKRKLTVSFEVQSEKGPPHMKTYTTLCKVGTIVTEGEGNGKKLSKKKAAEKMMEELKKLPPVSPVEEPSNHRGNLKGRRKQQQQQQQQQPVAKKKARNLIKEKLEQSASADEINPISQLIQIQQARKEKEPTYNVIDERGTARRREFVIEVVVNGYTATGTGPNKKIAKRTAAENLLVAMGISKPTPSTTATSQAETSTTVKEKKGSAEITDKNKKVTFNETDSKKSSKSYGSGGRQIVPGLLLVSSSETFTTPTKAATTTSTVSTPAKDDSTTASNHNNNSEKSSSPNSNASNNDSGIGENGVSPRDQLNYLAQLIGFSVSYSDFPKANHTEFLSLVTLSTDPPQMSHGSGTTVEESRDSAALKALSVISDIGIDNVKPKGAK